MLGQGSFGKVYVCTEHSDCAVKVFDNDYQCIREAIFLSALPSKYFPKFIALEERKLHMEKYDCALDRNWQQGNIEVIFSLARCLYSLHKRGIMHADISPANILIKENKISLMDFSLSSIKKLSKRDVLDNIYRPPESRMNEKISCLSDVYSFGIMTLEILHGPLECASLLKTLIKTGIWSGNLKISLDKEWKDFIEKCISPWREDRPSMQEIYPFPEKWTMEEASGNIFTNEPSVKIFLLYPEILKKKFLFVLGNRIFDIIKDPLKSSCLAFYIYGYMAHFPLLNILDKYFSGISRETRNLLPKILSLGVMKKLDFSDKEDDIL